MPQTTGLPAGPTSTHRTQTTNYNCKPNAPGAPPRREGAWCRLSGTSFSAPRGAGCLPGVLVACPGCWLSAPRSAGCRPHGVLVVGPRVLVVCPRSSLSCTNGIFVCPRSSLSCSNGLFRLPDATYPSSRAQKCRFCARNARKWGFRSQKAHKNLDFVLEKPENGGPEGKKRTKTPILCSKRPKMRVPKGKSAQKPRFCARKARK